MIPLPDKKYSIIYADPPWSYQNRGTRAAASKHYDTMTIEDIKRMGVGAAGGGIANEDCVLFMWATFPMLREALDVIEAWGFSYKTVAFNWVKQNRNGTGIFMGLGNWTRSNSRDLPAGDQGQAEAHQRQRPQHRPLPAPAAQQKAGRNPRQDRRADGRPAPYRAFRPRGCPGMGRVGQRSADA